MLSMLPFALLMRYRFGSQEEAGGSDAVTE